MATCQTTLNDKKQRVRVAAGLSEASLVSSAVTSYFEKTKALPLDISPFITRSHFRAQHDRDLDEYPEHIGFTLAADGQRLRVVFDQDQGPLAGKAIVLEPHAAADAVQWVCSGDGIADRYLPSRCRPKAG